MDGRRLIDEQAEPPFSESPRLEPSSDPSCSAHARDPLSRDERLRACFLGRSCNIFCLVINVLVALANTVLIVYDVYLLVKKGGEGKEQRFFFWADTVIVVILLIEVLGRWSCVYRGSCRCAHLWRTYRLRVHAVSLMSGWQLVSRPDREQGQSLHDFRLWSLP